MEYFIKYGWTISPNDKLVKSITKRIEANEGLCPCVHPENDGDLHCPCESYRERNKCCCGLYVKDHLNWRSLAEEFPPEFATVIVDGPGADELLAMHITDGHFRFYARMDAEPKRWRYLDK